MKIPMYSLLCLFFFSCGQKRSSDEKNTIPTDSAVINTHSVTVDSYPTSVEQIKQRYAIINDKLKRGLLDSLSFKYDCNKERSGTVTYFSDKGELLMIKHTYNEYSHFSAVDQYFISNNKLFFAHLNGTSWSFESGQAAEGATKDDIIEQRLYVENEKPLLCLEKKYTKRSHSANNPAPANVPNKQVKCKPIEALLKDFNLLVEFKSSANNDCLEK